MTAGHNALRGLGIGQKHEFEDALAQVGCSNHRPCWNHVVDMTDLHCVLFALSNRHITPVAHHDIGTATMDYPVDSR